MGSTASTLSARLFALSLFILPLFCLLGQSGGVQAGVKGYILPQYREKDGQLGYVIYGSEAENRGAMLYLNNAKIALLQDAKDEKGKKQAKQNRMDSIFFQSSAIPVPYPMEAAPDIRKKYWKTNRQEYIQAWIYTNKADYDKNTRVIRSNEDADYRSRDIDAYGKGFDAYAKKRLVHIRSNAKVVYYSKENKIVATSDHLDIDNSSKNQTVFTMRKNVKIRTTEDNKEMEIRDKNKKSIKIKAVTRTLITCDKLVLHSEKSSKKDKKNKDDSGSQNNLDKIECFDNVVITHEEIPADPQYKQHYQKRVMTGDYFIFDNSKLTASLRGNAKLTSGRDLIVGEEFEILLVKTEKKKPKKTEKKQQANMEPVRVKIKQPVLTYFGDTQPGKADASQKQKQPYHVVANLMDYDVRKEICTLLGNVICKQTIPEEKTVEKNGKIKLENQSRLSCNKMVIYLETVQKKNNTKNQQGGKKVKQIECFEDVVITRTSTPLDPAEKYKKFAKVMTSESDYAIFNDQAQLLTLTGRPILTRNADVMEGEKIELYLEKKVKAAKTTSATAGENMELRNVKVYMPVLTVANTKVSQTDDNSNPNHVTAKIMDYDVAKDICTLLDDVRIRQTEIGTTKVKDKTKQEKQVPAKIETRLNCEKMCIHLKDASKKTPKKDDETSNKELKKLECFKNVVITRETTPVDPEYAAFAETQSSTSDYAEFDDETHILTLKEKPVLASGKNTLRGEKMEIILDKIMQEGNKQAKYDPKNVKVFMPVMHYYENTMEPTTDPDKIRKEPVFAESNILHYDIASDKCTLLGNVVVDDKESAKITCEKMLIHLENAPQTAKAAKSEKADQKKNTKKQLKLLECFGDVHIVHRATPKDGLKKNQTSTSDYAVYDPKTQTMLLTGKPVLTSGRDIMSGEKIEIFFMEDEQSSGLAKTDKSKPKLMIKNIKVSMPVVNYRGDTQMPKGN